MDDIDKLYKKFESMNLLYKYVNEDCYGVISRIDYLYNKFNDYTKEEAVAAVLKWILNGRP